MTYWTPDQLPEPGKEMNFKYTITFSRDEDKLHAPDNAYVMQTRRSTGDVKQSNLIRQPDGTVAFIVDFTGADMKKLPADTPAAAQASTGDNAEIVEKYRALQSSDQRLADDPAFEGQRSEENDGNACRTG
ncbi:glucans biosynthesis protein G [Klebsiella aerogenes]|nr:glucans biosynthesis protein G [Klebsiella aerogenes]